MSNSKFIIACICMLMFLPVSAQVKLGNKKINATKAINSATDLTKAITLSDNDVAELSREYMKWMDANNPLAPAESQLAKRLDTITSGLASVNNLKLNFGVYEVIDVNAFACGDGSIRVCAGLMEVMTNDEIFAVISHEIGHVANTDTKDAMKKAYMTSAAANAAGAVSNTVSKLNDSQLGNLAKALSAASFSRKQENEADDFAFESCVKNGVDPYAMSNALSRLVELSSGEKSSAIQQMFSSHPDSESRSKRMKDKADAVKM